jgi:hypothetical protein
MDDVPPETTGGLRSDDPASRRQQTVATRRS